jgi:hypothetical protein
MSFHLMRDVLNRSQARPSARLILIALAERADKSGRCWPTIPDLCSRTGLGRTAVFKVLKELERSGTLTITRRHRRANHYQITLPIGVRVRETDATRVRGADSTPRTVGSARRTPTCQGTGQGTGQGRGGAFCALPSGSRPTAAPGPFGGLGPAPHHPFQAGFEGD